MEHPLLSIRKGGDRRARRYEHNNYYIEVVPSARGSATIWDKDILIYLFTLMRRRLDRGADVPSRFEVSAADLLRAIHRGDSGRDYGELIAALERLRGTSITTNLPTGVEKKTEETFIAEFSFLSNFQVLRDRNTRRWTRLIVEVPAWFVQQVSEKQLLTISERYFDLTRGIERRLYELARKHCGDQSHWSIRLELLHKKVGVTRQLRKFKNEFHETIAAAGGTLAVLEYLFAVDQAGIVHVFRAGGTCGAVMAKYLPSVRDTTDRTGQSRPAGLGTHRNQGRSG